MKIYPVEGDETYGYFYANDRVYIVDLETHQVVQSPGYLIPSDAMAYVEANPTTSVEVSGDIGPGLTLESSIQIAQIPDAPAFGYVYLNDRPVIVDSGSHTVIWVK